MNSYQYNRFRHQTGGFTLIELMLAITLGLLLIAVVLAMFQSSKLTFNTNEAQSRTQENGRFALEVLKREIRETGTHGWCAGRIIIRNHLNACTDFPNGGDSPLMGWEFANTGVGDAYTVLDDLDPTAVNASSWTTATGTGVHTNLNAQLVPGSDFFVFRRFEPMQMTVNANASAYEIALTAGTATAGDILMVTDCSFADVFQQASSGTDLDKAAFACSASGPGNDATLDWSTTYGVGAQVFRIQEIAYFVGFDDVRGDGVPGLYRLNLSTGVRDELIEGVENMQVLYGYSRDVSQGGDGKSVRNEGDWLTADQVPNWRQVISMRISMAIRSAEIGDGDRTTAQVFKLTQDDDGNDIDGRLAGVTITVPADGRLHQPFSTTIALRNQMVVP